MNFKEFILNLFFVHAYIGGVTWTLRVLLISSFIFPQLFLMHKKTTWWLDIIISIVLIYLSFTLLNIPGFRDLRYIYMIYLGLMIPKFRLVFSRIPRVVVNTTLPISIIILLGYRYLTDEYIGEVAESIVSFFVIGLSAYGNNLSILNFLDSQVMQFFGKISYSFYFINFSVLYLLSRFMFQNLPNLPYQDHYFLIHTCLFIISVAFTTVISLFVYKYIELPSKTWAKKVGDKISDE